MWLLLSVIVLGIEQVSKDRNRCGFYEGYCVQWFLCSGCRILSAEL